MRPRGISETTIAMCIMNIAGFVFVDSRVAAVEVQYALFSVIMAVTYLVLWYFWKGKNWARILVLLTGVVAVLNLFALSTTSAWAGTLIVIEAIFGIFMLWWLNTQNVKAYFKQPTKPGAST
ncbi:MAG: hypothetical protein RJA63_2950 [Pseudomonadota bacterium]|jgi:hypothetical protein